MLKLYKVPDCPMCADLAAQLEKEGHPFRLLDLSEPEVLADLRCNGVFAMSAPILEDEGRFLISDAMALPGGRLFMQAVRDFLYGKD